MGTIISVLNKAGEIFCQHGMTMLVQFGLLASLLFLADIAIRRRVKASLRYCLWCLLLIKLVLPTTLSLPTGIGQLAGVNFSVNLTQANLPEPQTQPAYAPTTVTPTQTSSEFARPINSPQNIVESRVVKAAESPASVETTPLNWRGYIFIVWLFGVLVLLAGFIRRIASVKKLITQSEPAPERLVEMVRTCQERIGVNGIVELRLSDNMASPAVCGMFRHVILVPTGLLEKMDRSKLAMVLMHELSHVKRADLWVNLFQTMLQIFYFYNPFVWAANAYARRVREQAVDEMVLTRLNCAAASYSNTLIDVAEKAFSRPRFGLATVSIIESKSKLKERIKIMLSKPIPKDTKIGFAGLALMIAFAAVLLPMAKAEKTGEQTTKNSESANAPFSAKLDNGVTVELVGICDYPTEGKKWWRPDGKELAETFSVKETGTISAGGKPYAILIKTSAPNNTTGSYDVEDSRGNAFLKVADSQGLKIKGVLGLKVFIDENRSETSVKATFAAGPWTVNIGYNGVGVTSTAKDGYGVTFASPQQTDKGVTLVVSDDFIDCDRRVVAIDDNNEVHEGLNTMGGAGKMHQTTAVFGDIKLDKIKEFQIQARPLKRVIFRNVSLRPGVKTDVQTLQLIGFKITSRKFQNGDSIEITDLSGPAGMIRPGETYIVSGRYTLKSHDDAALYVYATNGETSSSQGPIIKLGEGQFTRTFTLLKEGDLHLSFYPAKDGNSFGGVYFAQREADTGTETVQKTGAEVADVAVEDFNILPYPEGGLYTVTASIRNKGKITSPKFHVYFYKNDPERKKPMNNSAGPIKPGDVWNEGSMPFALNEGTNELVVLLDPDNTIGESDRTNNEASMTVVVKDSKIVEKKVSLSSAKGISKETTGISGQVINAAEFGDANSNKAGAENTAGHIDLLKQYPTTLTEESTNPQDAREWQFTSQDIYSISRFSFDVNNSLQIKIGPADVGIGHCKDGAVWAVVIPREHGTIKSLTFGEELIDHLWLRFHPREVLSLFPKDTVIAGGDKNLWGRMNEIAKVKMNNSWQAGGRAMIPAPKDFTVDADTKKNVRRFFIVDSEAKTAKYVAVFEGRTVPAQTSGSPPAVVRTTPATFANDVSADLNQLTVTFSQQMKDKSWAWVQLDAPYPETTGKPYYDEEKKTCTLPVKLEPGKAYLVAFNVEPYIGFVNLAGSPVKPYILVFATKDKDGKPTPIPEDLITKAKSINESAQKTSSGPEGKESRTESAPYTQIIYDDIRPDGTIFFKNTIRETNKSGKEIATQNFINSDFVEVTAMRSADGRDLKFTSVHNGDIYRYEVTFNEPIPPNGLIEYTSDGTMKGLIKPVAGSEKTFQYYMRHSPAAGEPTKRIETYLLPAGAELISTTPTDMERRTKDGRIELHVEKMIPIGGSITTSFQYRVP